MCIQISNARKHLLVILVLECLPQTLLSLKLKELPTDFANNYNLRLIELDNCYPSLVESAKQIQKELEDIGNDALVIHDLGDKVNLPFPFLVIEVLILFSTLFYGF